MDPIEEVAQELEVYLREYRLERSPRQWDSKDRLRFALNLQKLDHEEDRVLAALHAMRKSGYVGMVPWPKPSLSIEKIREGNYWVPRNRSQLQNMLEVYPSD